MRRIGDPAQWDSICRYERTSGSVGSCIGLFYLCMAEYSDTQIRRDGQYGIGQCGMRYDQLQGRYACAAGPGTEWLGPGHRPSAGQPGPGVAQLTIGGATAAAAGRGPGKGSDRL